MSNLHIVCGAGPIGWTVAEQLVDRGQRVRVLTRSGSGPDHPLVERIPADVADPDALTAAFGDDIVTAVHMCIHGSAYRAATWERELPAAERAVLDAAGKAGAVVVFPESLYSYSEPRRVMTEESPRAADDGKRGIRTRLLAQRAAHTTPTVSVVASDYFGPRALNAHAGERMVPTVLAGGAPRVLGAADVPHSFTYVPDLAAAMIAAADTPAVWNTVVHAPTAPAVTQRAMVAAFAAAAGIPEPRVGTIPSWVLRGGGLVNRDMRELAEMLYQFTDPFVMDSERSERTLGISATPLPVAAAETVRWWREHATTA